MRARVFAAAVAALALGVVVVATAGASGQQKQATPVRPVDLFGQQGRHRLPQKRGRILDERDQPRDGPRVALASPRDERRDVGCGQVRPWARG